MTPDQLQNRITAAFPNVVPKASWGETSFFVNPNNILPSGAYFATLKEKDGENDKASSLDRDGIFRLNFGPGKLAYESLFGAKPARPTKGEIISGTWDFTELDQLMPHPIYGWMGWMCILNPSIATFDKLFPLLEKAYEKAQKTVEDRIKKLRRDDS